MQVGEGMETTSAVAQAYQFADSGGALTKASFNNWSGSRVLQVGVQRRVQQMEAQLQLFVQRLHKAGVGVSALGFSVPQPYAIVAPHTTNPGFNPSGFNASASQGGPGFNPQDFNASARPGFESRSYGGPGVYTAHQSYGAQSQYAAPPHNAQQVAGGGRLLGLFQQIDANQDGVISWGELKQHGFVVQKFPGDVGVLLGDAHGSDWRGAMTPAAFENFIVGSLLRVFECLDTDRSGLLDPSEQRVVWDMFGVGSAYQPKPSTTSTQFVDWIVETANALTWRKIEQGYLRMLQYAQSRPLAAQG